MSKNPYDSDLGAAIAAFIQEHLDNKVMVTSVFTVAEYIDEEGKENILFASPPDQKVATTLGALSIASSVVQYQQDMFIEELMDDGEND